MPRLLRLPAALAAAGAISLTAGCLPKEGTPPPAGEAASAQRQEARVHEEAPAPAAPVSAFESFFGPQGSRSVGPRHELSGLSRTQLWAAWNSLRGDAYELDGVERFLEEGTRVHCDASTLVRHGGTHLRYQSSVQVDPAFRERLVRFEQLVMEVAAEVYGRAPTRLHHFGAYSCRSSRRRAYRVSEHALGNAIDVTGFDFARATQHQPLSEGLPPELRRPFQIRVARHWSLPAASPSASAHARFLRELAARLSDRSDVFRVMIGPSRSDHSDHFHFDMSPWHYVYF